MKVIIYLSQVFLRSMYACSLVCLAIVSSSSAFLLASRIMLSTAPFFGFLPTCNAQKLVWCLYIRMVVCFILNAGYGSGRHGRGSRCQMC